MAGEYLKKLCVLHGTCCEIPDVLTLIIMSYVCVYHKEYYYQCTLKLPKTILIKAGREMLYTQRLSEKRHLG